MFCVSVVRFTHILAVPTVASFKDSDDGEGGGGGKIKLDESTRRTWSMKSRDYQIDAER